MASIASDCARRDRLQLIFKNQSALSALVFDLAIPVSPHSFTHKKTPQPLELRGFHCKSLTMTYFHTGTRTIIGAKSFHCPVRDGKEWYQLAMVIRHNFLSDRSF